MKSYNFDIGRVSGSAADRKWNACLNLKLKFTMLSITEGGAAPDFKKIYHQI